MGCDIHIIAEVKENGVWKRNTEEVFKNPYFDLEYYNERKSGIDERLEKGELNEEDYKRGLNWIEYLKREFQADPSSARNYDWFAILADVRNGRGFAGVSTGEGFNVTAMPKGLPDDISDEGIKFFCDPITDEKMEDNEVENEDGSYTYYVDRDSANKYMLEYGSKIVHIDGVDYVSNPDYHSDSYLSIDELEDFDWNQVTMKYGVISMEQYKKLRNTNECPESWCGATSGGNIITVGEEEADAILEGKLQELTRDNRSFFNPDAEPETRPIEDWNISVQYQWSVLYSEWFKNQIEGTIEPLRTLADKYEDARIVFSFDN
jgi:hypothetical protein